mmetsp:Transcript_22096/g.37600  ORF Transcript_22096/g.37600 Transcript_22096/m.37600 type:complete len:132 (+) Transcript_22096:2398-2793(+)
MVFRRDMLLNIPLLVDFALLRQRCQVLIDENLRRQNVRRRAHDYTINQEVLLLEPPSASKLAPRAVGPPFESHRSTPTALSPSNALLVASTSASTSVASDPTIAARVFSQRVSLVFSIERESAVSCGNTAI